MQTTEYEQHELTEVNRAGMVRVHEALRGDIELTSLLGAVMYAGSFGIGETDSGYHFYLTCPNKRTAQALIKKSFTLYLKLEVVFPITRLIISTTADPFTNTPPDYWQTDGYIPLPDGTFLGKAVIDNHPNWYIIAKLDEDGRVVR